MHLASFLNIKEALVRGKENYESVVTICQGVHHATGRRPVGHFELNLEWGEGYHYSLEKHAQWQ